MLLNLHPLNALFPIVSKEAGSVTSARAEHPANALSPTVLTPEGISMPVRPVQLRNASLPMLVNVSGRVICVMAVHPLNAPFPMEVMFPLNTTFLMLSLYSSKSSPFQEVTSPAPETKSVPFLSRDHTTPSPQVP